MIQLEKLREIFSHKTHRYTIHAQEQMAIRHILDAEIIEIINSSVCEIIENYPSDKYSPSALIYGKTNNGRVLHVQSNHQGVIVTTYEPDIEKWCSDFKKRRK